MVITCIGATIPALHGCGHLQGNNPTYVAYDNTKWLIIPKDAKTGILPMGDVL
jgi:hypothetical protein